jgi:7-alpha-hydroxysteroid dehydrogenase
MTSSRSGCLRLRRFAANPVHRSVGYTATKGALNNLTRRLAIEWGNFGIFMSALAPAYIPTEMTTDPLTGNVPPDQEAIVHQHTPLGRLGRLEEIETAVCFSPRPRRAI